MSKAQIIKELALEVETLRNDYAEAIRQRDSAERELNKIDGFKLVQDAAKAEAALQEKIDGIKAGLIPVEELRKLVYATGGEVFTNHFEVRLRFDFGPDRIQAAIKSALTAKPEPARSRFKFHGALSALGYGV